MKGIVRRHVSTRLQDLVNGRVTDKWGLSKVREKSALPVTNAVKSGKGRKRNSNPPGLQCSAPGHDIPLYIPLKVETRVRIPLGLPVTRTHNCQALRTSTASRTRSAPTPDAAPRV